MAEKEVLDQALNQKLQDFVSEMNPNVVHTYLPMGHEINLYPTIQYLLDSKIVVVCPRALTKPKMKHLRLESLDMLEEGKYGTRHPSGGQEYNGDLDLIIVPGLAFNSGKFRLGYGGGYYDYFLSSKPNAVKIGLFYTFQLENNLMTEPHDIPLDYIITN